MHTYIRTWIGMAAAAALGLVVMTSTAQYASAQAAGAQPAAEKKAKAPKDTGEYDIYNEVIKDASANPPNAKKFLTDLDNWSSKYPETDYKAVRQMYYVQAHAANNDMGKSLDSAKPLLEKGVDGLKTELDNPGLVLQLLFLTSSTGGRFAATGNPTPDQTATGIKGSQMLLEFGKTYFAAENKPANLPADQWAQGLKQVEDQAKATLFQIALYPGASKLRANAKDPAACAAAEPEFKKTQQEYPDSGMVALQIATVSLCQQATNPAKAQQAIFEYARAAALPVGGITGLDAANQKAIDDYLVRVYTSFHGSNEGLDELRALALKSPLPPDGFKIKTTREISTEKEEEFRTKNPQLAMWMNIKGQLADTNGQQYFEEQMKEHDMSGPNGTKLLKGVMLEARPACRSKELLIAIPLPDAKGAPVAEITIRIVDAEGKPVALTGKPEAAGDIQFNGVPSAFVKDPFMLTMDAEKANIDGLSVTPCTPPPAAKKAAPPATKKGAAPPAKKK